MDPVHARYPFLAAAREAVREADVGLAAVVTGEERSPAVERGVERVRRALLDGTVEPAEGRRWNTRAELLSYPVARVLVSLLDAPGAVEKYASAEADTAFERFTADFEDPDDGLRSTPDSAITRDALLREFDLARKVSRVAGSESHAASGDPRTTATGASGEDVRYRLAVGAYLRLASGLDGDQWRLPTRELTDGQVVITERELHELLREAVRERVAEGLPTRVPDEIREGLTDEVAELEETFSEVELSQDIDVLAPECFPPCATALLDRKQAGENLPPHAEFALVAFLASVGADAEEVLTLCDVDSQDAATAVEYRLERVADDAGAQYAPPSCATMAAYGECPHEADDDPTDDARCESVAHPLTYYEEALADAESVVDWREAG